MSTITLTTEDDIDEQARRVEDEFFEQAVNGTVFAEGPLISDITPSPTKTMTAEAPLISDFSPSPKKTMSTATIDTSNEMVKTTDVKDAPLISTLEVKEDSPEREPVKTEQVEKEPVKWILGEDFAVRAKHHESIKALWETKWNFPCLKSVYPFHDGKYEDFEKVFSHLIKHNINDGYGDAYTAAFFPVCADLRIQAARCTFAKDFEQASSLYLRAACLYRISRFPIMNSAIKWKAWEMQKDVYIKAASSWADPIKEENIPHTKAAGADGPTIPVYYRVPSTATAEKPVPTVLLITGLDGYRPDNTQRTSEFLARGWGCVIAEIPGTADCPADPQDPESPDRLWDSVFEWMHQKKLFNMSNVTVWGLSCGGFYAVRIAHTHKQLLRGVVAHGAGIHHMFDKAWLDKADYHEYPFT